MFDKEIITAAQVHALEQYPNESCGLVVQGQYLAVPNIADNPQETFLMPRDAWPTSGEVQAVIHSHPKGNLEPSRTDQAGQIQTAVPWGIIAISDGKASGPLFWGAGVKVPPLVGRGYRQGPSGSDGKGDCYALVRDYFLLERGITLDDFPREEDDFVNGFDLYRENFEGQGFRVIGEKEIQPGDCCLMQIRTAIPNHAAVYLGNGLGLHHLCNRLSRKESLNIWHKFITHWLRYEG
jgi:proteasome lid subunit RPN8/RPN11